MRGLIVIVLPLLTLTGCGNYEWHQKLTVTVDTPNGPISGASVMKMRVSDQRSSFNPPEARGVSFTLSGEAAVVQVAPGRYLFALRKGVPSLAEQLYPKMDTIESAKLMEKGLGAEPSEVMLSSNQYPLLVTFDDIKDPASVKRVNPANLEATFGPGYRLNGITLSLTKEPVTKGEVEKVLPAEFFKRWGSMYRDALADGGIKNPFFKTFAASLGRDSFTTQRK
ncbi:hypothetical protein LQK83_11175 [Rhizobium sp. C1]|nr:hypothetical protein [Rhizobium sp. C1]